VNDRVLLYSSLAVMAVATLGIAAFMAWSLGMLRQPRALVQSGEWQAAAIAAQRLGESWMRIFPSVREAAAHARAACLHLEGKLDESLAASRELRDGALLEGANLVMAGGDPRRAVERLTVACASARSTPEDLLFLALATHSAGAAAAAEKLFEKAGPTRPKSAPSPRIYEPAFHYLRGLYLVKTNRPDEAAADLEAAAESPITTIYVERARALLPVNRPADLDPRSSLTGQVIDE
jgi:tetratricopeptide (TPR) repeat protein